MSDTESLDGVFIIDKPADWTSHDVVGRMRRILQTRRIGHTGTLDPFATGVLVVCINRATRLVRFLTGDEKEYLATLRLGFATDTGDLTGKMTTPPADARAITPGMVDEALTHFRGRIKQTPPMYSAKKIGGTKLYELARRGLEVEREPIEVEIKELELSRLHDSFCSIRVLCTAGTYVRTLAEDLGRRLGVGAHLTELRRTRAGSFGLNRAVTLEQLAQLAETGRIEEIMVPMAEALPFEILPLSEAERAAVAHGRSIRRCGNWANGAFASLCDQRRQLLAVGVYNRDRQHWDPQIVLFAE